MSSSPSRPLRRTVLTLAAALVATVLPVLPVTPAVAAPVRPAPVLLPAPVVTPATVPAGTQAVVTGNGCTPQTSTRVYVTFSAPDGDYVASTSSVPAADGTWTARITPPISSPAGSYTVSATCDSYNDQRYYRPRTVPVTASTASPWTGRTPSLPSVPNGTLQDVDCAGAVSCVAVGHVGVLGGVAPLIETWNGTAWAVASIAATGPGGDTYLDSVDCPTATRCVAVGDIGTSTGHETFVAILAGTTWTSSVLDPPPNEREASLTSVSCPTKTVCFAVGTTGALSEGSRYRPTAYRLQGTTWSPLRDPVPSGPRSQLGALSCADVQTCVAIGDSEYGSVQLAEVFDGTFWHTMNLPALGTNAYPRLVDIACATTSACAAVGSSVDDQGNGQPLVEVLTDTTWKRSTVSGDPAVGGRLSSVSCGSSSRCTAVGETGGNGTASPGRPLVATRAGSAWSSAPVDVPAGATASAFHGVSCAAVTSCVAVGDADDRPLAAVGSGADWSDAGAVAPDGFVGGQFQAVACSAVDACTAGGWTYGPGRSTTLPLVNRWDGTRWSLQALPNVGNARIDGVACPSATLCFAAGRAGADDQNLKPLLLQWKGGPWKRIAVTVPHGGTGVLTSVSCSATTSCLAVGESGEFGGDPLAVALTGSTWKLTPTPPVPGLQYTRLTGVSCVAGAGCRVVGSGYDNDTFESRGIDLVWKGSGFSAGPPVVPSDAVSCVSGRSCVAVGGFSDDQTAAAVFDGTAWTAESLPDPSGSFASIDGIACRGALACVAVGGASGPFVARRSTTGTWTAEPVAPTGSGSLHAVACPTAARCVAVGDLGGTPAIVVSPTG